MLVVNGEIVGYAGYGAVEGSSAEVLGGDDFTGGGFD